MVRLRARHAQRAFEQVAEISMGSDSSLKVHVFLCLVATSLRGGWFEFARQYLTKTRSVLKAANLRFVPATGRPPGLTEDVRERIAVLSQIIYWEAYLFLVVNGTEPKMPAGIEKEFRHELQVRARFLILCEGTDVEGTANVSASVRDLSVDHADTGNPVCQGCAFDYDYRAPFGRRCVILPPRLPWLTMAASS